MANDVAEQFLRVALQSLKFGIHFADDVRLWLNPSPHVRTQSNQLGDLHALQALQKNDHIAVRHFYGLVYFGHRPDLVQVRGGGILDAWVELSDHRQKLFVSL